MEPDRHPEISPDNFPADQTDVELLRRWKSGEQRAADVLVDRYVMRLVALVASRMQRRFRDSIDPEDVVQSALGSFFDAARHSRVLVSGSVSLWRLLATFARRKMARSIERQMANKRGGDQLRVSLESVEQAFTSDDLADSEPFNREWVEALGAELPTDLREVLQRLLAGMSQREIAQSLSIDERTVRRRVVRLRAMFSGDQSSTAAPAGAPFTSTTLPRIEKGHSYYVLS